jgi:ABC-type transport system involved in multi-copper enzyme maturation permease subunit
MNLIQTFPLALSAATIQGLAALPWLIILYLKLGLGRTQSWQRWLLYYVGTILGVGLFLAIIIGMRMDPDSLVYAGGVYGAILQIQLTIDLFVLIFAFLFLVWRKGAAVALSAFREGWRQPMFWLILSIALAGMLISVPLPYFTLESGDEKHIGGDFKMVKELGYDFTMLAAALFGVFAASMSISEEIEGRTAITLMSKPISRRDFLLGKFVGIMLAALIITGVMNWVFDGTLLIKLNMDREPIRVPLVLQDWTESWRAQLGEVPAYFLRGACFWLMHAGAALPGIVLGFCQVMVLIAIAVALATRLPMVVNLIVCLVIFFLGHLAPVLQQVSQGRYALVTFVANLIYYVVPALESFDLSAIVVRDVPPPTAPFMSYVGMVSLYAVIYSAIALLFGLILFEDRDLA